MSLKISRIPKQHPTFGSRFCPNSSRKRTPVCFPVLLAKILTTEGSPDPASTNQKGILATRFLHSSALSSAQIRISASTTSRIGAL